VVTVQGVHQHFLEQQHCRAIDIHTYLYICIVVAGAIIVSSGVKISVA
jgi:hypothetical protein